VVRISSGDAAWSEAVRSPNRIDFDGSGMTAADGC
jgi:hypothetical protein